MSERRREGEGEEPRRVAWRADRDGGGDR